MLRPTTGFGDESTEENFLQDFDGIIFAKVWSGVLKERRNGKGTSFEVFAMLRSRVRNDQYHNPSS
jgi:hypothetical protein